MRLATIVAIVFSGSAWGAAVGTHIRLAPAPLTYAESSQGLEWPEWDGGPTEVEMADIDGDGHVDLVTIGDHGNPYVNTDEHGIMFYRGDGAGTWSVTQTGTFGYGGIAVGDVNRDGLADVAYGMHHNNGRGDFGNQLIEVALGDGTGAGWEPWDDGLATNGESWGMFGTDLADVDGDGDLDLGSNSFGYGAGIHVYRNEGDGTWNQTFGFLDGNSTYVLSFGDVNADGNPDICAGHQFGTVYLGDGTGDFVLADGNLPERPWVGRSGPSLGDVDGDGRDDLAWAENGSVFLWRSVGDGVWEDYSAGLPVSGGFQATDMADMDGNGSLDIVVFGSGTLAVFSRTDSGWRRIAEFQTESPGSASALRVGGDVDHNGRPDIALVAMEGRGLQQRNHLRVFREKSPQRGTFIRLTAPGPNRVLRAGAVFFADYAAAIAPDEVEDAWVDLDVSYAGPEGPWLELAVHQPPSGRIQVALPRPRENDRCHLRVRLETPGGTFESVGPELLLR